MITVCKNCEERYIGCHSKCERYGSERARIDLANANRFDPFNLYLRDAAARHYTKQYRNPHKLD